MKLNASNLTRFCGVLFVGFDFRLDGSGDGCRRQKPLGLTTKMLFMIASAGNGSSKKKTGINRFLKEEVRQDNSARKSNVRSIFARK